MLLTACALLAAVLLAYANGHRAILFACGPPLLFSAYTNWDLVAVLCVAAALHFHGRGRYATCGALLGLGMAAKLYPAIVAGVLAMELMARRQPRPALPLVGATAVVFMLLTLPFALVSTGWTTVFAFNARRPPDIDSLWSIACAGFGGTLISCPWSVELINAGSLALTALAVTALVVRRVAAPRNGRLEPLAVLSVTLLASKVYSPQYSLWLLPWFVEMRNLWWYLGFVLADAVVIITRHDWLGRIDGRWVDGTTFEPFHAAVLARALILGGIVVTAARVGLTDAGSAPTRDAGSAPTRRRTTT